MWRRRKAPDSPLLPLAALVGQTGRAMGPPPSAAEFRALSRDELPAGRRAEVESHIAHDPAVFRAFLQSGVVPRASREGNKGWAQWFLSPAGIAAAVICTLGPLAWFLAQRDAPVERHGMMASTRPSATAPAPAVNTPDWRRRTVRQGFENPGWFGSSSGADAQAFSGSCSGDDCGNEIDALADFGARLSALSSECRGHSDPGQPLDGAGRHASKLRSLRADVTDRRWSAEIQGLERQLDGPAREACASVARIVRSVGANPKN